MIVSLAVLLCRVRGMDYGYYEAVQVDLVADPAWLYLVREFPRLRDVDLVRLSHELDDYASEAKRIVAAVFRTDSK